jgi:hypothetical protein
MDGQDGPDGSNLMVSGSSDAHEEMNGLADIFEETDSKMDEMATGAGLIAVTARNADKLARDTGGNVVGLMDEDTIFKVGD